MATWKKVLVSPLDGTDIEDNSITEDKLSITNLEMQGNLTCGDGFLFLGNNNELYLMNSAVAIPWHSVAGSRVDSMYSWSSGAHTIIGFNTAGWYKLTYSVAAKKHSGSAAAKVQCWAELEGNILSNSTCYLLPELSLGVASASASVLLYAETGAEELEIFARRLSGSDVKIENQGTRILLEKI